MGLDWARWGGWGMCEGLQKDLLVVHTVCRNRKGAGAVGIPREPVLKRAPVEHGGGTGALLSGRRHTHICRPEALAPGRLSCSFGVKAAFETRGTPRERRGDWAAEQTTACELL